MLEVRDMHAYYGKSHILQGVNLNIQEGEIVALLGRNGVGRSTTCKAVMGGRKSQVKKPLRSPTSAWVMCLKTGISFPG